MAIEWIECAGVWTARIEWAAIKVFSDGGQWQAYSEAPAIRQGVGHGSLEIAQREALRLLENTLWGPCKALIAARGGTE